MHLHHSFSAGHRVVTHFRVKVGKAPAMKAFVALASNVSPIPTRNVPEITVTFSRSGCQCGAMRYPSGIFSRIV